MKDAAFWSPGPALNPDRFRKFTLSVVWSKRGAQKNNMESSEVTKSEELRPGVQKECAANLFSML